jgi:hypothetical protein
VSPQAWRRDLGSIGSSTGAYRFAEREEFCFYDSKGVAQGPDRHIRVWTKCASQKDLESIDIKNAFGEKFSKTPPQKLLIIMSLQLAQFRL